MKWRLRDRTLSDDVVPVVMGVVNVTPDSFSDGGQFLDTHLAVEQGRRLTKDGADIIDVGGESTRPGSDPVGVGEQISHVLPVVKALASAGIAVSIDTRRAAVAQAALEAGAVAVNDISALSDPKMSQLIAGSGAGLVLMHMKGQPKTMQDDPKYDDVVSEVRDFLVTRAEVAERAGIDHEAICVDPGIGFGKTLTHSLELLRGLEQLAATGYPVLVGTSRKGFLGEILGESHPLRRDVGTAATVALAIAGGAFAVRVHDVAISRDAALVAHAIVRSEPV